MEIIKTLPHLLGGVVVGLGLLALDERYHSTHMQTFRVDNTLLQRSGYCPRWYLLLRNCEYVETSTNSPGVRLSSQHDAFQNISGNTNTTITTTTTTITFLKPERALFYYWQGTING